MLSSRNQNHYHETEYAVQMHGGYLVRSGFLHSAITDMHQYSFHCSLFNLVAFSNQCEN